MWTWLASLPLVWQVSLIILVIGAVIGISVFGNFVFKGGLTQISLGRIRMKGRSCGDCVLILMGKRELLDSKKEFIQRNILKDQMNYVEQKLIEVQTYLTNSYREDIRAARNSNLNLSEEYKQYRLYCSTLQCALEVVKDEIRRSLKENGFYELSGTDFSNYVKDKAQALVSLGKNYIVNQYPYEGMIVSIEDRLSKLDNYIPKIEDMCFNVFQNAKDILRNSKALLSKADSDFAREIDEFTAQGN